ncbi:MAG: GNAT family N-acetyltransferase [Oscillospiraceae bacterium]|nr:GNAT family N-acetyltransferase [Oscillospiraceae bacterium]
MSMIITKAEKSDLKEILELQYLAFKSEAKRINDFSIPPLVQTYDEKLVEYQKKTILKAVNLNGKIIGSVSVYTVDGISHIEKLIVNPEFQKQGVGKALLLAAENEYPSERYELYTGTKNSEAISLYERVGYVGFKEEKVSDNLTFVYMEKYKNE